ncbi:unnamed protein product [Schistocephalus solidus]|uniref:Hexosyltransferase n=1 Tax=Schistocephalus solidus TaxID=70667 RepID=A0A183TCJ6_SCHSO|nr:unnamed protein product [Schistocephalus solidus]
MILLQLLSVRRHLRRLLRGGTNRSLFIFLLVASVFLSALYSLPSAKRRTTWSSSSLSSPGENVRATVCASDWYTPIGARVNGSYFLLLKVPVDLTTAATDDLDRIPSVNVVKRGGLQRLLSFEDMVEIDDRLWRLPVDTEVYLLYPQSLNLSDVVRRVKSCRAVPESPLNNRPVQLLHVSSTICPPEKEIHAGTGHSGRSKYDLVVIVKSAVYNFQNRQTFRSLYERLNNFSVPTAHPFRIGIIFSVGLPRRSGNQTFKRDGFYVSLPDRAGEALSDIQHTHPLIHRRLKEELSQYNDLLVGDYEDTYYNLTTKMMINFQWAARFCRTERPGFLFLDDDYGFHPANLRRFLARLEADWRERMVIGLERTGSPTVRFGEDARFDKWALSKHEMPAPQLPPFSAGAFYFLGYARVEEVAIAMHFTRSLPLDDVWLGMIMTKLGLRFQYRPGIRFTLAAVSTRKRDIIMPMSAMYRSLTALHT